MKRQKIILTILLVILGLAMTYAFWNAPRQARVASTVPAGSAVKSPAPQKVAILDEKRKVRLDLLPRKGEAFAAPERNIFRLTEVRPQPAPPPPVQPPPPPVVERPVVKPPPLPVKPLPHFTFLGFLEKAGQKTVFLTSNNEIYLVKAGQQFGPGQEFQIAELTDENLVIHQVAGGAPITVPLTSGASASSFAAPSSFRAPIIDRRPGIFKPPRIPKRRTEPGEVPSMGTQPGSEPEAVDPFPDEEEDFHNESPPPDVTDITNGDMSSLPLRSMIQ